LTEPNRQTVDVGALLRKPLWTIEDLASYLDVPVNGLRKQRADGKLYPGYVFGKHLRFKRDEVFAWIELHRDEA
jgi:excisionase family DNA binding protein